MNQYECFSGRPGEKPAIIQIGASSPQDAFNRIMAVSCCPYKQLGEPITEDWDGSTVHRFPIQNGWQIYVKTLKQGGFGNGNT